MDKYDITVTSASGIEAVTKRELTRLGFNEPKAINGSFSLRGDALSIARLNMFLRTADRVYIKLTEFKAETFDDLFDGVYSFPWEDILNPKGAFIIDGKARESKIFALSASQRIVKKAIIRRLSDKTGTTYFPETAERYLIDFTIFKDEVTILLNTSGAGLHKRGYRDMVGIAPIKETIASAMLMYSDFGYEEPFADVFCGSGTIVIEGARQALNIAPGILRGFDYTKWQKFDSTVYELARKEAIDNEKRDKKIDFIGYDISPQAVKLAKRHVRNAGLDGVIDFYTRDVADFSSDKSGGTIVTNAPYGSRSLDITEARNVYKDFGKAFKKLDNWSCFLLTSDTEYEKYFGKKADKNRKLYNSNKECRFYEYFKDRSKIIKG